MAAAIMTGMIRNMITPKRLGAMNKYGVMPLRG